jgi:hypothetical protein
MTAVLRHCRTIDLTAVRERLTAMVEDGTFDGQPIRVNPWLADVWSPPCALIGTFTVTFDDGDYDGLTTATCSVRLVVNGQALRPAQQDLDLFLTALLDAFQQDRTLNDTALLAKPVRAVPVTTTRGNAELPSYDVETVIVL